MHRSLEVLMFKENMKQFLIKGGDSLLYLVCLPTLIVHDTCTLPCLLHVDDMNGSWVIGLFFYGGIHFSYVVKQT